MGFYHQTCDLDLAKVYNARLSHHKELQFSPLFADVGAALCLISSHYRAAFVIKIKVSIKKANLDSL